MTVAPSRPVDPDALQTLVERALGDFGAVLAAALVTIGDRLGLYRALAERGPSTAAELAGATGTTERNIREWLAAQAAAGYVTYDGPDASGADRFSLTPEQAAALADETSPAFVVGGFQVVTAAVKADELVTAAFRSGTGVGWHEHHHDLFAGTERFFRPGYAVNLVGAWLPALDGVADRMRAGARVADVGCGHGASTILMAQAFPASTFAGFDYHAPSIAAADRAASDAGVPNAEFGVAAADGYAGGPYDLICFFDSLHDMGDPVGALRHARAALSADGTVMLVEPQAGDTLTENLNPVGRVFYAASTLVCTPVAQSQNHGRGTALGAQAGEARLAATAREAGFTRVRRAAETPFNLVLELRP
ncbi:Methyltransferase domain-containing protein [Pseudonocardia thermophila]|uniref:Methyltransferase domain-containing protein n=1 Tax=Pseudonocardia thermophila TaxID=1848 RepID=A0A1M6PKJ1_PSETH|nr:class I SAM-dependent methyltransferase [Pseudonocardia thermophila]SHK08469.1 Methyltransferase domain-containing protein [Pseudonocardia thermophila]